MGNDDDCSGGKTCCNWDNAVGGHITGQCGEMCAASFSAPTSCTAQVDCAEGQTCCSWDASFGYNARGVCGEMCALSAFEQPKKLHGRWRLHGQPDVMLRLGFA